LIKDPKEEFKTDPVTLLLEIYGQHVGPEQQMWLQIIVRSHKKSRQGGLFSESVDWKHAAEAEIKKLKTKDIPASRRNKDLWGESHKG